MSDLIVRLRIESEIDPSSVFELGSRGKPEPPDLDPKHPETSGYSGISPEYSGPESLYHTFWSFLLFPNVINRYSLSFLTLHVLSLFPSPKHQIHHPKSISRPRKLQIGMEDHPFQSFLPGVVSVLTGWLQFQLEKVPKLGLNGLIVLGCFKRFLLGQSSSYESLY